MAAQFTPTQEQQAIMSAFASELAASPSARRHLVINAGAGTGKALRNDQRVVTPSGLVPIADLVPGDLVAGTDGAFHAVLGVYPQGVRALCEVIFDDGTKVVADHDHIWTVLDNNGSAHDLTTRDLMRRVRAGETLAVPPVEPVPFDGDLDVEDVVRRVRAGEPVEWSEVLVSSVPARVRTLTMLCDGDDVIDLPQDSDREAIVSIIHSLGWTPVLMGERGGTTVGVICPKEPRVPTRIVADVRDTDEGEATCIEVDAPDRLFLTEGFVPTHNTTTLRLMSEQAAHARGLYIAFNKSVADSASKVFGDHIECRTSHALAFRHIKNSSEAYLLDKLRKGPQRDERKLIYDEMGMVSKGITVQERRKSGIVPRHIGGMQLVSIALSIIERFCQTASREPSAAHIPMPSNFVPANFESYRDAVWRVLEPVVHRLWEDVLDANGRYMRFQHGHYLKVFQLSDPVLNYDFILLDEAQDTAPVTEDIVVRQASHALLVMVGDPSQAIYGFTGARDSMTRFENSGILTTSLTLSESWRFGPEVAAAANSLLEHTDRDMRIVGRGRKGQVLHHLDHKALSQMPSVFVCRSNFDVIEAALSAIAAGAQVDASSVDLTDVEAFLDGAAELKSGKPTQRGGLGAYPSWDEFMLDFEEGVPMTEGQRVGMMLLDKYGTEAECKNKIALIRSASDAGPDAVKVITIHKAKGGEWPDVSVRYDSAFRRVRDANDPTASWWEIADPHLAYVAVTRAIDTLDPGHLWPVVEYGIVCEPRSLLAAVLTALKGVEQSERAALVRTTTAQERQQWGRRHAVAMMAALNDAGVKDPSSALDAFVTLVYNVLRAQDRGQHVGVQEPDAASSTAKQPSEQSSATPDHQPAAPTAVGVSVA